VVQVAISVFSTERHKRTFGMGLATGSAGGCNLHHLHLKAKDHREPSLCLGNDIAAQIATALAPVLVPALDQLAQLIAAGKLVWLLVLAEQHVAHDCGNKLI
jgi:hypothetical protein